MKITNKNKEFQDVFTDKYFDLPLRRNQKEFYDNLTEILDEYQNRLKENKLEDEIIKKVENVCEQLIKVIELYYSGESAEAFTKLKSLMDILEKYIVTFHKSLERGNLPTLYRTRVVNENRIYDKREIFHPSFNIRTHIGNSRYSLAGYPCLYLSTTVDLCHFESGGKSNQYKIFSEFELKQNGGTDIVVLDMGQKPQDLLIELSKQKISSYKLEEYYYIYPLLAASSFIKPSTDQKFVPEYIVPQLLLQWFKSKYEKQNKLCGIRYFSSKDITNSNRGFNYVFPSKFPTENGKYCDLLLRNFEFTEPIFTNKENDDMNDLSMLEERLSKLQLSLLKIDQF